MNRTLDEEKPNYKKKSTIDPAKNLSMVKAHNCSYQNLRTKDNDSVAFSGLSLKDEWTEIELYNGVLHDMRRNHEKQAKKQKIADIRNTLKLQIQEQKKLKDKELAEKIRFDKYIEKVVKDDEKEGERIKWERRRKMHQEKVLRDEQRYLEKRK